MNNIFTSMDDEAIYNRLIQLNNKKRVIELDTIRRYVGYDNEEIPGLLKSITDEITQLVTELALRKGVKIEVSDSSGGLVPEEVCNKQHLYGNFYDYAHGKVTELLIKDDFFEKLAHIARVNYIDGHYDMLDRNFAVADSFIKDGEFEIIEQYKKIN